jgi:uncharacterized protein (TIGR02145 family)
MKYWFMYRIEILVILCLIINGSCKKEQNINSVKKVNVSGIVQKGPYISGGSVTMYQLGSTFLWTGESDTIKIKNNDGSFEFSNIGITSKYAEFYATGNYFNEITGELSNSPLTLSAISDISNNLSVNVNVLTQLEKSRLKYLVSQGINFSVAKDSAQQQVLAVFGLRNNTIGNSELLNIYSNTDGGAILLTISLILQMGRNSDSLFQIIKDISDDIQQDGILNNEVTLESLRNSARNIDIEAVQINLEKLYQEIGISSGIPGFTIYLDNFLSSFEEKPTVALSKPTNVAITTVILNGFVNPNNLNTSVSFEYGIDTNYGQTVTAIQNSLTGHKNVLVSALLSGLTPSVSYHYRIKASNSLGTTISDDVIFKMHNSGAINDIEGTYYNIVHIGNQVWMSENLNTTKFNDGSTIPFVSESNEWINLTSPGYCWPDNDEATNRSIYGPLYNWYCANTGKLCPSGWHVPADVEWQELISFLGGDSIAGGKIKESGIIHWKDPNTGASNESGFTALPAGFRYIDGSMMPPGYSSYWWSVTEFSPTEAYRTGTTNSVSILYKNYRAKIYGYSIRCIENN